MTKLVKSPCVGCRFAEWDRSADGRRAEVGTCSWRPKSDPTPWWVFRNGIIFSADILPDDRRATCAAREEA